MEKFFLDIININVIIIKSERKKKLKKIQKNIIKFNLKNEKATKHLINYYSPDYSPLYPFSRDE